MGVWSDRVVPRLTDRALSTHEVMTLREAACDGLGGRVLELGFGSGLNLPACPPEVTAVDAVEPSDLAWRMSRDRRIAAPFPVTRAGLDGQRLAAPDASYDAVLSTFTLCTIPDAARTMSEVRRVLRPGGAFHFLEHGLAPDRRVARWQHRLEPAQSALCGGCHLTRDVPRLLEDAGLEVEQLHAAYLAGPAVTRPWGHGFVGRAVAP